MPPKHVRPTREFLNAAIDKYARIIALKSTLKRKSLVDNIKPIAGAVCSNADICAYLDTYLSVATATINDLLQSGSDIRNELDWSWGVLGGPSSNDPLGYASSGSVKTDLTTLQTEIGTRYADLLNVFDLLHNIQDEAETASSNAAAAVDNTNTIIAALPYPNSQANDVHADINRAIASIILANTVIAEIQAAVTDSTGPLGTLLQVIGLVFPNHSGGNTVVNYNDQQLSQGEAPPYAALTAGSATSLGTSADVDILPGTYGYLFNFTVPSYWARQGYFANDLTPSIAILDWSRDAYSFDNPKYIRQANWLAFPLHPAANRFTIDLRPGVTGTMQPLRL